MENTQAERLRNTPWQDHRPSRRDSAGYEALKEGAGLVDRYDRTVLRLTGRHPVGKLDAILTHEVTKEANHGVYAALLNPKGRVEIEDLSLKNVSWGSLGLYGPYAYELLDDLRLSEHESTEIEVRGTKVLAAGVAAPVPGFDLLGPEEALRAVREHLERAGAEPVSPESYETARIEAGLPRFGTD